MSTYLEGKDYDMYIKFGLDKHIESEQYLGKSLVGRLKVAINDTKKIQLINLYRDSYRDTACEPEYVGKEFYEIVVPEIINSSIPLALEFLLVSDFYDEIVQIIEGIY